jgi:hypothetical protein
MKFLKTQSKYALVLIMIFLAGCGTAEVSKKTDDTYSVTSQYGSMNGSWDRAAKEALDKAVVYCEGRRQKMILIDERRDGIFGVSPQRVDITFKCADGVNMKITSISSTEEKLTNAKMLFSKGLLTETQYNEQVKSILNAN